MATTTTSQGSVSLEDARRVTAAGEDRARELGQPQNIAVADGGGNLVSDIRMVRPTPLPGNRPIKLGRVVRARRGFRA